MDVEKISELVSPQTNFPSKEVTSNSAVLALQEKLMPLIGEEIHVGEWFCVTQKCINQFSEVTDDRQWIHVDPDRARIESPFRSTIAQGFLVLSLLPRLRGLESSSNLYGDNTRMVINQGARNTKFFSPVRSETEIRSRTTLHTVVANKRCLDIVEQVVVETRPTKTKACYAELKLRVYL